MKKIMKQFTPKRTAIAKAGSEPLELPNYSGVKRAMKEGPQSIADAGSILFSDGKNITEDNSNLFIAFPES